MNNNVIKISSESRILLCLSERLSDDTSGWIVVTLMALGMRYFICNIPGLSGMKLSVSVAESGPVPSEAAARRRTTATGRVTARGKTATK